MEMQKKKLLIPKPNSAPFGTLKCTASHEEVSCLGFREWHAHNYNQTYPNLEESIPTNNIKFWVVEKKLK